jgi:hypothetical protein
MSIRERVVEQYLLKQIKANGGFVRKLKWVGVSGAPDRFIAINGQIWLVELKRPTGGVVALRQKREHEKLTAHKVNVIILDSKDGIDEWLSNRLKG